MRHPACQCLSSDPFTVCPTGAHDDPRHAGICVPQQHPYCCADDPHPDLLGPEVRLMGAKEGSGQGGEAGGLSCKREGFISPIATVWRLALNPAF